MCRLDMLSGGRWRSFQRTGRLVPDSWLGSFEENMHVTYDPISTVLYYVFLLFYGAQDALGGPIRV